VGRGHDCGGAHVLLSPGVAIVRPAHRARGIAALFLIPRCSRVTIGRAPPDRPSDWPPCRAPCRRTKSGSQKNLDETMQRILRLTQTLGVPPHRLAGSCAAVLANDIRDYYGVCKAKVCAHDADIALGSSP